MSTVVQSVSRTLPKMQFYRRQLPQTCVDFSSQQGKSLFTQALNEGHANIYFKLAAQFRTQEEPAYCGLSTLVMVLNALEVDPGRIWKGAWRWYHESMLECCQSLEIIKQKGINLSQFVCTARCNRLNVQTIYANSDAGITDFRKAVIASVKSENEVLVASYNRKVLGQTGSGHFSPISAFNPAEDSALIMDVARFKYPPHWVKVDLLWKAMQSIDPETEQSRGYCIMTLRQNVRPLITFRLSQAFLDENTQIWQRVAQWRDWLNMECPADLSDDSLLQETFSKLRDLFKQYAICCKTCAKFAEDDHFVLEDVSQCCRQICTEIKNSDICKKLLELVNGQSTNGSNGQEGHLQSCCSSNPISLTVLLLTWPYECEKSGKSRRICGLLLNTWNSFSHETVNELTVLKEQIETVISEKCTAGII